MLVLRCPNVTLTETYYNLSRPLTSSERVDVTPYQSTLIVGWSDPKPEDLAVEIMSALSIQFSQYIILTNILLLLHLILTFIWGSMYDDIRLHVARSYT